MNIIIKKYAFLESLQTMVISQKSLIPILANVLLRTGDNSLSIISTDLDTSVICKIDVDIIEEGSITLPFKKLLDIVREMPEDDISIKVNDNYYTAIASGKSLFNIFGLPEDDYPNIPEISGDCCFSILSSVLKRMIKKVAFSAAIDDSRRVLNGCCLSADGLEIKITATDGYILSYAKYMITEKINHSMCVVLSNKTLNEIIKVLKDESIIDVYLSSNQIMLSFDDVIFISRLIDGNFPDYKNLIPKITQDNVLQINKNTLLNICRRVSIMTTEDINVFDFSISNNIMEIKSFTPGIGEAKESITGINYKGEYFSVKFKSKHMINVLKNIDLEEIDMLFISDVKAGVINIENNNEEYFYFIVPIIEK